MCRVRDALLWRRRQRFVLGPPCPLQQGPTSLHMPRGSQQQSPALPTPTPCSPQPMAAAAAAEPQQVPHNPAQKGGQPQQRRQQQQHQQQQRQLLELLVELACLDGKQQALLGLEQPPVRPHKRLAEQAEALPLLRRPRRV